MPVQGDKSLCFVKFISNELFKVLQISNGTLGPPVPITQKQASRFRIFPNGVYKVTLAAADHADYPFNIITVTLYIESQVFEKNFQASL